MSEWRYPMRKGGYKQYKDFLRGFEFSFRKWVKIYNGVNPEENHIGRNHYRFKKRIKNAVNNQIRFNRKYNHKEVEEC